MAHFPAGTRTFGIEIELFGIFLEDPTTKKIVLPSDPHAISRPHGTNVVREALSKFFRSTVFPFPQGVNLVRPPNETRYDSWTVTNDGTIKDENDRILKTLQRTGSVGDLGDEINTSRWVRENEARFGKVPESLRGRIRLVSMEIVSPVLPATKDGLRVVELLYNDFLNSHSFVTNNSCGLHVHVAKQKFAVPDGQFSLRTLKNLAQVAMAAEFQLACLQPEHRVFNNSFALLSTCWVDPRFHEPRAAFDLVEEIQDRKSLVQATNGGICDEPGDEDSPQPQSMFRNVAVNFARQCEMPPASGLACTIEFRSGEASLMTERVLGWVEFVLELVRVAMDTQKPLAFLRDYGPHVTPEQLLGDLGLPGLAAKLRIFRHNYDEYLMYRDCDVN